MKIHVQDNGIRSVFPQPRKTGGELQTLLLPVVEPGELTHLASVMGGYGKDEFRPQEPLDAETSL
jgi:hypothetical protein